MRLGLDPARGDVDAHHGEMHAERADGAGGLVTPLGFERPAGERRDRAQRDATIGHAAHERRAVHQRDVGRARLEVRRRDRDDLLHQPRGRPVHGAARHHRGAAGGAADPVRHPARVAQVHGDIRRRYLQHLGADLGERGREPLSQGRRPRGHHDRSLGGQDRPRALERPGPGRLHDGRQADAESHVAAGGVALATGRQSRLVPTGLQRLLEHLAEVLAREVGLPSRDGRGHGADRVRRVVRAVEIAATDLGGVQSEARREQVDDPLAHERALVESGRAHGARRRLVRHDAGDPAAVAGPAVRAGQVGRGEPRRPDAVRAQVAAQDAHERGIERQQLPALVGAGHDRPLLLA